MNNRNNDNEMAAIVAVIVAASLAALCMLLVLYVLAAFACLLLTLLCLAAWNKRLPVGKWTIEPAEARGFVGSGAVAAIGLVCLVEFADMFLGLMWSGGLHLPSRWPIHCAILGYIAGSLWFAGHCAKQYEASLLIESPRIAPTPPTKTREEVFAFASWDDEERYR